MRTGKLLMNPGPTNVPDDVRQALLAPNMSHRDEQFKAALHECSRTLLEVVNGTGTHRVAMFVSSGTGANEALLASLSGKVAIIVNGRYSERLVSIAERLRVPYRAIPAEGLGRPPIEPLRRALLEDPGLTHVFVVHVETTTGVVLPLGEIGELCRETGKFLYVDAISSVGGHAFDVIGDNVAACSITPNKCIESVPGIAFVVIRDDECHRLADPPRSFYFDLKEQLRRSERHLIPYTAAVPAVFACLAALRRLNDEGVAARIARYRGLNDHLAKGLRALGLDVVHLDRDLRSSIVVVARRPPRLNYRRLAAHLRLQGIEIYSPETLLDDDLLLFASMGDIAASDIDRFLSAMGAALQMATLYDQADAAATGG